VSKRKQIITSIAIGSAITAISVTAVSAAPQPAQPSQSDTKLAQTPSAPPAPPAPLVPNPKVTIDGVTPNSTGGTTPTLTRAVAPPVGDISVSNIDAMTPQIQIDSKANINMVLKDAPAQEVLESLARSANLNLAYSNNPNTGEEESSKPVETVDDKPKSGNSSKGKKEVTVTLNFRNEPVQNAFNYVLQISGLEANRIGNTIFVGKRLPDSVQETIVRTLRMNQIPVESAASFLATQGAEARVTTFTEKVETVLTGPPGLPGTSTSSFTTRSRVATVVPLKVDLTKTNSPVVLRGLAVSTDERLNSITLIGSPRKVQMASAILTRLDARRRQVALNVKIVDVNLSNANSLSASLSFGTGNGFFSVDKGAAVYNYGGYNPPSNSAVLNSTTTPPVTALNLPGGGTPFLDYNPNATQSNQAGGNSAGLGVTNGGNPNARPNFGTTDNPYQPGYTAFTPGTPSTTNTSIINGVTVTNVIPGTASTYTQAIPTNFQYPTKFLSTLQAQIISGNGKILTDPTLVVQEGQKSTVNLTQEVFAGFKINSVAGTGATTSTREPIIKQAGLIVDLTVNRIDDNGFISVAVAPTVSSIGSSVTTPDGDIALLQSRTMNSGEIRLRDGQTLILSGIIQESDRSSVSKVPVLGDIPLLGALFRSTNKTNQRQEVVILLTPQILNDNRGQVNFTPGADARSLIGK
jgi:type IV pilus assembly protein PilQ